ncbi:histidine phosphatase superfamily [Lactifluus volemus]|nr:histidine phosphatase superfamily [Lactifluus volemus]
MSRHAASSHSHAAIPECPGAHSLAGRAYKPYPNQNVASYCPGVVVITRNGDRYDYYQDPITYQSSRTDSTPLGETQAFQLGSKLRSEYFDPSSVNYIHNVRTDLVDLDQVHARIKNGGEGRVVFDSTIALLQGLFPPTEKNTIELANETNVTAPLGGYQYVPAETVEPAEDRSLESWIDCPAFEAHVKAFYASSEFKAAAEAAKPFFRIAKDFIFGDVKIELENAVSIYDFMNHQLTHNKTYAHRLPPTLIEQARYWANFHEEGVFSDPSINGIGNIAGRTILQSVINSLERITYDGDPLQFLVESTTYQPFISLFKQTEMINSDPTIVGIPDFASALVIELRRGSLPDNRDFLRFKFKNGTDDAFRTLHVFGRNADIALTEFIYRVENAAIGSNTEWMKACGASKLSIPLPWGVQGVPLLNGSRAQYPVASAACGALFAVFFMLAVLVASRFFKRANRGRIALRTNGDEGSLVLPTAEKRPGRIEMKWERPGYCNREGRGGDSSGIPNELQNRFQLQGKKSGDRLLVWETNEPDSGSPRTSGVGRKDLCGAREAVPVVVYEAGDSKRYVTDDALAKGANSKYQP